MPKSKSDHLFQLIKSLKKSEKRYFKLWVSREDRAEGKKFIRLFDMIDAQDEFDEEKILEKEPTISPIQLSNLKAHVYRRILQSLRMYHNAKVPELETREMIDFAQLLFNRSLYGQCVKMLQKAKKRAKENDNLELLLEILKWEKIVLSQTISRGNQKRVNTIVSEVQDVNNRINNINSFTNLAIKLSSSYLKAGFVRNQQEDDHLQAFMQQNLPVYQEENLSFNEKLHLYELFVGYNFYRQDFEQGMEYAQKWVALFEHHPEQIGSRFENYIKALNNLMIAQYKLLRMREFIDSLKLLKSLRKPQYVELNENLQLKLYKYNIVHEFNRYFLVGDFEGGVSHFNKIKVHMEEYISRLDQHSRLVMYYKIACLYFGNDQYSDVIFWLNKIINMPDADIREDVHCFARILNLISHYELGNNDVLEYYLKSTFRFLFKKDDLHLFQKYILNFMKKLNRSTTEDRLIAHFENLLSQLLPLTNNRYEKRAFIYFDIISWLESKIQKKRVKEIIKLKAAKSMGDLEKVVS